MTGLTFSSDFENVLGCYLTRKNDKWVLESINLSLILTNIVIWT